MKSCIVCVVDIYVMYVYIYMTPVASLLKHHGVAYHLYADDTQLFQEFRTGDTSPGIAIRKMELYVASIRHWMKNRSICRNSTMTRHSSPKINKPASSSLWCNGRQSLYIAINACQKLESDMNGM